MNFLFATKASDVGLWHRDAAGAVITCVVLLPWSLRRIGLTGALGKLAHSLCPFDSGFESVLPGWLGALDYLQRIC